MGVLNLTPDSFHEASRLDSAESAVLRAIYMVNQGADWIDIGGESTRPGAAPVDVEEEIARVCLLYTSPSPRDRQKSRMPSSA